MEGFVNNNVASPFDYGLKHSKTYANYGVDKTYIQREPINQNPSDKTQSSNTSGVNNLLGTNIINSEILDNITENIDKTVTDSVDTIVNPNKTNHDKLKTAGIIGSSVLVVGGIVLGLTRGKLSKKLVGRLSELIEKSNYKIERLRQSPSNTLIDEYKLKFLQTANNGISRLRGAFFNITPLKDVMFKRVVQNKCKLDKPCNAITNTFRKLSFGTVKSAYRQANADLNAFADMILDINKKISSGEFKPQKPVIDQAVEALNKSANMLKMKFNHSFGEEALNKRNEELIQKFDGLSERVYDRVYGKLKDFVGDVDEWTTFVPEKLVAADKADIIASISAKKRSITNGPQDIIDNVSRILADVTQQINPKDTNSLNQIKTIKFLIERYKNISTQTSGIQRKDILDEMSQIFKDLNKINALTTGKRMYSLSQLQKIRTCAKELQSIIKNDKKGAIEELLTTYKSILPESEYIKLKKAAIKTSKSLNKAVHKEGSEYVDKARDLAVGSALTDVAIGMGLPLATTTVAISVADTKQKKRSVVLKYGIPLLLGVGTSTLCTIALISGGYALMLGSAVSLIGNEVLERVDNYLIKQDNKKANQ